MPNQPGRSRPLHKNRFSQTEFYAFRPFSGYTLFRLYNNGPGVVPPRPPNHNNLGLINPVIFSSVLVKLTFVGYFP